jgi:hypothetical protein
VNKGPGAYSNSDLYSPNTLAMFRLAGTESCQVHHIGYVLSGRMKVVMDGSGVRCCRGFIG